MNLLDPFSPAESPSAPPAANSDIAQQWSDALNDPTVRTALLQFGISALQPPSFGDTTGSILGRAVGSAGEAVTRKDEAARKQQESDSKDTLRQAQATSAEARATAAGARASAAGAGLDYKRGQLINAQERLSLTKMMQGYSRHSKAVQAYNNAVKSVPIGDPVPSFKEWAQTAGYADVAEGPPLPSSGGMVGSGEQIIGGGVVDLAEEERLARAAIAARPDLAETIRAQYKRRTQQNTVPF
jgi:hypothetical protein